VKEPTDDEPSWLSAMYWFGWFALWIFGAIFMLMCIFGCLLYNWRG
jgi:hypothetical protein